MTDTIEEDIIRKQRKPNVFEWWKAGMPITKKNDRECPPCPGHDLYKATKAIERKRMKSDD